jgi:hypothetical protein
MRDGASDISARSGDDRGAVLEILFRHWQSSNEKRRPVHRRTPQESSLLLIPA